MTYTVQKIMEITLRFSILESEYTGMQIGTYSSPVVPRVGETVLIPDGWPRPETMRFTRRFRVIDVDHMIGLEVVSVYLAPLLALLETEEAD